MQTQIKFLGKEPYVQNTKLVHVLRLKMLRSKMRNSSKWSIRTYALVFEYSREFKIFKILKIFPALKRNKESKLYFNIKLENARRPSSSSFLQNKTIEE